MKYETIAQRLLDEKICKSPQSANATQAYYYMWIHGQSMDKLKRQFREHKRRLLLLGIDISQKLDITHGPIMLKASEVIEVRSIEAPAWYRHAIVPTQPFQPFKPKTQLRLVA